MAYELKTPKNYLRKKRLSLKLKQREIAEICGIKKDVYRKYEEGERKPSEERFAMMKEAIERYEQMHPVKQEIDVVQHLENLRERSLVYIFNKQDYAIVNSVFDFILRNM